MVEVDLAGKDDVFIIDEHDVEAEDPDDLQSNPAGSPDDGAPHEDMEVGGLYRD